MIRYFSFILILLLTACNPNTDEETIDLQALEERITELEEENIKLRSQLEGNNVDKETGEKGDLSIEDKETKTNVVSLDKPVVVNDFAEVTLKKVNVAKRIDPPKPDSFYSYYEVEKDGNTYIDFILDVKNLQSTAKEANEFLDVKVIYNSKYEYSTFTVMEEDGGQDLTSAYMEDIDPLLTERLHFLAEVPDTISEDGNPIEMVITIQGEAYSYFYK